MTEEQKELFCRLTPLQKKVCIHSLKGKSNYQSYVDAGGTAKTKESRKAAVSKMLSNVNPSEFLKSMRTATIEKAVTGKIMERAEALERLSMYSRGSMSELVEFSTHEIGEDKDGYSIKQSAWRFKDSAENDPEKMACITELTAGRDGLKIKIQNPVAALKELSELQGWGKATKLDITSGGRTWANFCEQGDEDTDPEE